MLSISFNLFAAPAEGQAKGGMDFCNDDRVAGEASQTEDVPVATGAQATSDCPNGVAADGKCL